MNELMQYKEINATQVFVEMGLEDIIQSIEVQARSMAKEQGTDISTELSRKSIKSIVRLVAKSRTALFDAAKNLTEEWRENTKKVNAQRNIMEERLYALEAEINAPVLEFEAKEQERIEGHEQAVAMIEQSISFQNEPSITDFQERIATVKAYEGRDWQEFKNRAEFAYKSSLVQLGARLDAAEKAEAGKVRLAQLEAMEQQRMAQEQENKRLVDAEERAKAMAAQAIAEAEAAKAKAIDDARIAEELRVQQAAKAEADRIAAEAKAKADAESAEAKRLADIKVAEAKAAQELKDAEDRHKAQIEVQRIQAEAATKKAADDERLRLEAEAKAKADAEQKRAADIAHRTKINNEALNALILIGVPEALGKEIISAIAKGQIPNIKIFY